MIRTIKTAIAHMAKAVPTTTATATRKARPIVVGSITEMTAVATTKLIAMEIKLKTVVS
jgi:hypothetical protein